jgi:hypothetical protein
MTNVAGAGSNKRHYGTLGCTPFRHGNGAFQYDCIDRGAESACVAATNRTAGL